MRILSTWFISSTFLASSLSQDIPPPDGPLNVAWWSTSKETTDRLTEKEPLPISGVPGTPDTTTGTVVTVDLDTTFQKILGFGGALTQSSAYVFAQLPSDLQAEVMDAYFDHHEHGGIGYTIGRLPIHSCDFSLKSYTFDDEWGDYNLEHFDDSVKYDTGAGEGKSIPMIDEALKRAPNLKLYGSPWSPPAWMKTTNQMLAGGKLRPEAAASWAKYFSKWISAYESHGVPIWGVTVQNEPEADPPWESCIYSAQEEVAFVAEHLGPVLAEDHPNVKILGFDHNKDNIVRWADALMSPYSESKDFIDGVAFHWYSGSCFHHVSQVYEKYPSKVVLPSEACYELTQADDDMSEDSFLEEGSWSRGEGYGFDIMGDLNSGSSGWTDWNILLDQDGGPNHLNNFCDAPILAETRTGYTPKLYYHPQFYYMGHFSKFIFPDSVRAHVTVTGKGAFADAVGETCPGWPDYGGCVEGGLHATAFRQPDNTTVVVVVMNCGDEAIENVVLVTDGLEGGLSVEVGDVPAHGIQTYIVPLISTRAPTMTPSPAPTKVPFPNPSKVPTPVPSASTPRPSPEPSDIPTALPYPVPTTAAYLAEQRARSAEHAGAGGEMAVLFGSLGGVLILVFCILVCAARAVNSPSKSRFQTSCESCCRKIGGGVIIDVLSESTRPNRPQKESGRNSKAGVETSNPVLA